MKIIRFLLLISLLLISSCWEATDEKTTEVKEENNTQKQTRHYPWKDFSMNIPKTWNVITSNKDIIPKPKNWNVELAITSSQTKWGFSNNLMVLSQELNKETSSKDYSIINNVWAENEYINYYKIEWKNFVFSDWEKSRIYIFKAKYTVNTPLLKFIQTAYVCDKKAFFITLAIPLSIKETKKYEDMIATFKCN